MKLTPEKIEKMKPVWLSIDQFAKHLKRVDGSEANRPVLEKMEHGDFLGVWVKKDGSMVRMHLKKIWIKPYNLSYRTTKTKNGKARKGKELLIANFPLPRGRIGHDI